MLFELGILYVIVFTSQLHANDESEVNFVECRDDQQIRIYVTSGTSCVVASIPPYVPQGYERIDNVGYYKFYPEAVTWNTARVRCRDEGAHLAIIDSDAERKALVKLFNESMKYISDNTDFRYKIWLGAHDLFQGPKQNCGSLDRDCECMDDSYCQNRLAFICEMPKACL